MTDNRAFGPDVSFWQDNNATTQGIDFRKMKSAGASFCFVRAGQNIGVDSDFTTNWRGAREAGLLRGAYHFYDYRQLPLPQAQFIGGLLAVDDGELPPVLDIETVAAWGRPNRTNLLAVMRTYLTEVERLLCVRPMIYTNPDMILNVLSPIPAWLLEYKLWIAHYGVTQPSTGAWDKWTFWQWTDREDGARFGVESKQIDMNFFNGTEEELRIFAGVKPAPPTLEQRVTGLETWARGLGYEG